MTNQKFTPAKIIFTFFAILTVSTHLFGQGPELWGMTSRGRSSDAGVIFKTDIDGTGQVVNHEFFKYMGQTPEGSVTEATNGKLYGMTSSGGVSNSGVLFEYDPVTEKYNIKVDFDGTNTGRSPLGDVIQASNGKLYGMTRFGGANNRGVIFEFDLLSNDISIKVDFDGTNNGGNPIGTLLEASNGKLYGMTVSGGVNNLGVLFEYDLVTENLTKLLDFDGSATGNSSVGSLIEVGNGLLYGLTTQGGANNQGVLFEYEISTDTYTKKHDFDGTNTGALPVGSLIEVGGGVLYGMTRQGGLNNFGVIFEYDPATSTLVNKFDFNNVTSGSRPRGTLIEAADGSLYGMTSQGGANNDGVIFEFETSTTTYSKHHEFDGDSGSLPLGSLCEASNGKLYGMTSEGGLGISNAGAFFEFDINSHSFAKLFNFDEALLGKRPLGSLTVTSEGRLFGMTNSGGEYNAGTIFEYHRGSETYTVVKDFERVIDGSFPKGALIEASSGSLYGMTNSGGANSGGVLFEFDPSNGTYTNHIDFDGTNTGDFPTGSLMKASDGKLYGVTSQGGVDNKGVLFQFDPATNVFTNLYEFSGTANGQGPVGELVEGSNGVFYGMTRFGGANSRGVIFEYDLSTDTYTKKLDFDGANNGNNPEGSLIKASNGKLYGMATRGGVNDKGVLFEFDIATDTYTKHLDFDEANKGALPYGSLVETSNGLLYGLTGFGGINSDGVLFEFDPSTNTYSKKLDFENKSSGYYPEGNLIELPPCESSSNLTLTACVSFTVPSGDETYTTSGIYNDTIPNELGCDSIMTIDLTITPVDISIINNSPTLTANASGSTFRWLDCDSAFDFMLGETDQDFVASSNGNYAVEVTQNGCTDTSACQVVANVGLDHNNLSNTIQLFPNPTSGSFTIEVNKEYGNINVLVQDALGKEIFVRSFSASESLTVNLKQDKGVYFVHLSSANGLNEVRRVVVH